MKKPSNDFPKALFIGLVGLAIGLLMSYWMYRPWTYGDRMGYGMMGWGSGMMGRWVGSGSFSDALDRHFIEQMIPHHEDAIVMADLALLKTKRPEIRQLAEDIKRDQTREIGEMRAWYQKWFGKDVSGAPSGEMMGHGMMGRGTMMGMMGDETDLAALESAKDFDRAFIEQMIPHHQMAVMMAGMLIGGTDRSEMVSLGESITASQSAEIDQMRGWYHAWYAK
jgi:uncharacterized protein (DUF305 family)